MPESQRVSKRHSKSQWYLENVPDDEVISGLETWVNKGRGVEAMVIAHIAEIDHRQLYRDRGHPSMHAYCVHSMNFSEAAAFNRIAVGRTALRFPRVLDMIAAGQLHVSGAKALGPVLDEENADRLLDAAAYRTRRQIAELVAAERPRQGVATKMISTVSRSNSSREERSSQVHTTSDRIEPLAAPRYALQVTISQQVHDKLRQAQDLLRHAVPDGDVAAILERGLDLVIEQAQQTQERQLAATERPRSTTPREPDDTIPAAVRREVIERDGYQCSFEADNGTRCGATAWLRFDRIVPRELGGPPTASNLRLLCGWHSRLETERTMQEWASEIPAKQKRGVMGTDRGEGHGGVEPFPFAVAKTALLSLGFKAREASAVLDTVRSQLGDDATTESVICAALRACPLPGCREPRPTWMPSSRRQARPPVAPD